MIDKDHASALLALSIRGSLFLISTAVEHVYLNREKAHRKMIDEKSVAEAGRYTEEGHLARGISMPKIKAIVRLLEEWARRPLSPTG